MTTSKAAPASSAAAKANDYAIESLKLIITLSSAILAFTVTFVKDLHLAQPYILLLPTCWALLIAAIVLAWLAITEAAYALEEMSDEIEFVFSTKTRSRNLGRYLLNQRRHQARSRAAWAQGLFIAGLIMLALLGWSLLTVDGGSRAGAASSTPAQAITTTVTATPLAPVESPALANTPTPAASSPQADAAGPSRVEYLEKDFDLSKCVIISRSAGCRPTNRPANPRP
jgi:hypothetical protein